MTSIAKLNQSSLVAAPPTLETHDGLMSVVHSPAIKRLVCELQGEKEGIHSFAVLSKFTREGRTLLVSALGLGFAMLLKKRVLIINSAARDNVRAVENGDGAPFSRKRSSEHDRPWMWSVPMIDVVNPKNLEESTEGAPDLFLGRYLQSVRSDFDVVIVDTCALNRAQEYRLDPLIMAKQVDAAILLLSPHSLQRKALQSVHNELSRYNVNLAGMIFNRHPGSL